MRNERLARKTQPTETLGSADKPSSGKVSPCGGQGIYRPNCLDGSRGGLMGVLLVVHTGPGRRRVTYFLNT